MKRVNLAGDFSISQLIQGCMGVFVEGVTGAKLKYHVEKCLSLGITTFDHADMYGMYEADKAFGEAVIKDTYLREKMQIITKCGIIKEGYKGAEIKYVDLSKENITYSVEQSLKHLHTEYIDLLLIHRPDFLMNPEVVARTISDLIKQGKVLHVGVSNFLPHNLRMLKKFVDFPIVTNQIHMSLLYTEALFDGSIDLAWEYGFPLMAYKPMGEGRIFMDKSERMDRMRKLLNDLCQKYGVDTIDKIMYAWLYTHPVNICPITGALNFDYVKSAADAVSITLEREDWYKILLASRGHILPKVEVI